MNLSPEDLHKLKVAVPNMPEKEKRRIAELLETYKRETTRKKGKDSFLDFIMHVYPGYKIGPHHRKLAELVEDIAAGKLKRVMVSIAPRMGKSELISYLAPAWLLGKFPQKKVIMASHTADLAVGFGRRVRNLVGSDVYKDIFPTVELQADSKSASRWGTNFGGEYFAMGVGAAMAGKGADFAILDDVHSEQDGKANNITVFNQTYSWFQSGPLQRLMPGGSIIIVMCMTGDTPVLMADGVEKRLDNIKIGDMVATYNEGKLSTSRIMNWQSSGVDSIYTIRSQSGKILRANKEHPFLVDEAGVLKWVKTQNLKLIHRIVQVKGIGGSGKASNADMTDVWKPQKVRDTAFPTTIEPDGPADIEGVRIHRSIVEICGLKTAMGLLKKNLTRFFNYKTAFAQYVSSRLLALIPAHTGITSSALTTVMTPTRSEACYAMTAISPSGIQKMQLQPMLWQGTSDFTSEQIESIEVSGQEEVFDIEVEHTGNFIANGFVSHNTRWSKNDLIGQIIDHSIRNDDADNWMVVEFPAIFYKKNDETGYTEAKSLWPEFWPVEELLAKKASMDVQYWQSQYMQDPVSAEGALIKADWWQIWPHENPPPYEYVIMSLDAAQEATNRADFNALQIWGIFKNNNDIYNIILLDALNERLEFPELKALVYENYNTWKPDSFIVEKKSNGAALYQEMRKLGIPVSEFTPSRGNDKVARVNSVTDLFSSGIVWMPDKRWAREVQLQCQDFPFGRNDDQVDAMSLALMRFRQGGFVRIPTDEPDPVQYFKSRRHYEYY